MSDFQITLRAARVNRGMTLKKASELASKSVDTLMKYERDSTDIPRDLMMRLLALYDLSADVVFFGRESDFIGKYNNKVSNL